MALFSHAVRITIESVEGSWFPFFLCFHGGPKAGRNRNLAEVLQSFDGSHTERRCSQHLGNRGDVVKVADGYGRNYLLPRKLAMQATDANKAVIEQMKSSAVRRSATEKTVAEELWWANWSRCS